MLTTEGKKMDKRKIRLSMFVILIIVVIFLITYLTKPSVATVKAVSTDYENKIAFEGIYFTQENVIYNGEVIKADLKFKNGNKVPKGINIYENLFATESGILCTHLDGYENKFQLENLDKIGKNEIKKIINNNSIKSGIKIINNSEWFIYAMVDKNSILRESRIYNLEIGKADNYYPAQVINIVHNDDGNFITFKVKNDLDTLDLHRGINGYIIKSMYYGVNIPQKAVISMDKNTGVFIKTHGYAEFRRVKLLFTGNDIAIISPSTVGRKLQNYDDIICNPEGIVSGTKIR